MLVRPAEAVAGALQNAFEDIARADGEGPALALRLYSIGGPGGPPPRAHCGDATVFDRDGIARTAVEPALKEGLPDAIEDDVIHQMVLHGGRTRLHAEEEPRAIDREREIEELDVAAATIHVHVVERQRAAGPVKANEARVTRLRRHRDARPRRGAKRDIGGTEDVEEWPRSIGARGQTDGEGGPGGAGRDAGEIGRGRCRLVALRPPNLWRGRGGGEGGG